MIEKELLRREFVVVPFWFCGSLLPHHETQKIALRNDPWRNALEKGVGDSPPHRQWKTKSYVAFHSCGNLRCSRRREAAKRRTKTIQTGETCAEQNRIPESLLVKQKTGNFFVLSTPLIELPIQKTLKKTKNWSKTADTCPNQHTIEKGWLDVVPTHLPWRTLIINHCVTIYHTMPCKRSR